MKAYLILSAAALIFVGYIAYSAYEAMDVVVHSIIHAMEGVKK